MADNVASGSYTISADELTTLNGAGSSGVVAQRVKIGYGDDGTFRDASTAFPLPVNLAASAGNGAQTTQSLTASAASTLAGATSTSGSWVIDVSAAGNVSFHLLAAAFVGTVVFEQSFDPAGANGTWAPVPPIPEDVTTPPVSTLAISTAVAYIKQFTASMFGPKLFRVRCSAWTSGTLVVLGSAGPGWYEGQPSLAPSSNSIGLVGLNAGANVIGGVTLAVVTTGTTTTANTAGASTASTVLAADANRDFLMITSRATAPVNLIFGATTPTATLYSVVLNPGATYEVPQALAALAVQAFCTVATQPLNFTAGT